MAAEIINLRQARKQRARAEAGKAADQNRLRFGRSKAEKRAAEAEKSAAARKLDAHKLTPEG
jgi:hypothetical protein